ncbi:hypothetical protein [Streptomyces sp. 8L]|uniref:hypothetical protein n=1 Tax=Streptomyces sp. 8L TaxID=2877242 RepID=UPI001CD57219|nr:hypothetical protein [Streptomyces sp. 8L]MCA1223076.1 hypothetical protein [Streptomyces sp. 8L]
MSTVEERLRAALAAKADTVTHAGLRAPLAPVAGRAGHRLRTAALFALAAAVIGVALALPAALARHTDQPPATRPHATRTARHPPSPSAPAPVPSAALPSARPPGSAE